MSLFFIVFFTLYSGLHIYAFLKAKAALAFGTAASVALALFMALMVFAPVVIREAEKHGLEPFARFMSYVGYTWMGVLFLFFSVSVIIDLYRLAVYAAGFLFRKDLSPISISNGYAFAVPLVLSVAVAAYGYFEAKSIRTERVVIKTPKIPAEIGKITIAQVSDVHVGLIIREERLARILGKVKEANPDIFVSTGDLVDGQINGMTPLARLLRDINPRYGKFAIPGNHEYYAGIDGALAFTRDAGFTVIRDSSVTGLINIAGVDDPAGEAYGVHRQVTERGLLSGLPKEKFTLFLKHRPLVNKNSFGLFDLQLSGHAHKGQIFPFTLVIRRLYPVAAGWLDLPKGSALYVSRGSGTWGPPIRFLAPPEVTIIELVHEVKQSL